MAETDRRQLKETTGKQQKREGGPVAFSPNLSPGKLNSADALSLQQLVCCSLHRHKYASGWIHKEACRHSELLVMPAYAYST